MHRFSIALALALSALPLRAEDIALSSRVSEVTLYPQGASVTREAVFSVPAGHHEMIVADLPEGTDLDTVRVSARGAVIGRVRTRRDYVPPRDPQESAALRDIRAEIDRIEAALRRGRAAVADIRAGAEAAEAQVAFLARIGTGGTRIDISADRIGDLAKAIGTGTRDARLAALEATRRADTAGRDLKTLTEDLQNARQALRALVPEDGTRAMVAVSVMSDSPVSGALRMTYTTRNAGWQPAHDLRLDRDSATLRLVRGALVRQATGENWRDVTLRLSTARPSEQIAPGRPFPWLPRISDPEDMRPMPLTRGKAADALQAMAEPVPAAAETARAQQDGLALRYDVPAPVTVTTGADQLRLDLGTQDIAADLLARAVPLHDDRAYLVARLANTTGQVILPTTGAAFYLDGRYVGRQFLPMIPDGAEADLPFGPIDGLRLTRAVVSRSEGARGVITRATEFSETLRIEVENLTSMPWPVELLDRVPRSEQDALSINWQASPAPTQEDVENRRGVLAWRFDLAAGATQGIDLSYRLRWPGDKVLHR